MAHIVIKLMVNFCSVTEHNATYKTIRGKLVSIDHGDLKCPLGCAFKIRGLYSLSAHTVLLKCANFEQKTVKCPNKACPEKFTDIREFTAHCIMFHGISERDPNFFQLLWKIQILAMHATTKSVLQGTIFPSVRDGSRSGKLFPCKFRSVYLCADELMTEHSAKKHENAHKTSPYCGRCGGIHFNATRFNTCKSKSDYTFVGTGLMFDTAVKYDRAFTEFISNKTYLKT